MLLTLLSPAKTLDFQTPTTAHQTTRCAFLDHAAYLVDRLRALTVDELRQLLTVSPKLARHNHHRYATWQLDHNTPEARPAALAYSGLVFQGLQAQAFNDQEWRFAQDNVRVLSALYGVLRPTDAIREYRLELATRLKNDRGETLYDYWSRTITDHLAETLLQNSRATLLNLASQEYWRVVKAAELPVPVVTPVFRAAEGAWPILPAARLKMARGSLCRFVVRNKLQDVDRLKEFNEDGYAYDPKLSKPDKPVFTHKTK